MLVGFLALTYTVSATTAFDQWQNNWNIGPCMLFSRSHDIVVMLHLSDYDYELPAELIAQQPPIERTDARMMLVDRLSGHISSHHIRDFPAIINPGDAIVLNDTKVVPARLRGTRLKTGGKWEGLFIERESTNTWRILSKTRGMIIPGERVGLLDSSGTEKFTIEFLNKTDGGVWLVKPSVSRSFLDLLGMVGEVPLPPYIRGGRSDPSDLNNYQTVYANKPGAVAAPTAGLHFTHDLLNRIKGQGTHIEKVTLHVGIGTFRPMVNADITSHKMHSEWGCIDHQTADKLSTLRRNGGRICSVGTTSVRVLETCADEHGLSGWEGQTDLYISPGYRFRGVDALLTNFHLPKSSLLVLVRTFGGQELIKEAYAKAIELKYRFYSYGDAMLIT